MLLGFLSFAVVLGGRASQEPKRCPEETYSVDNSARCCAAEQIEQEGSCYGRPRSCPAGFDIRDDSCVVIPHRVAIPSGRVRVGPSDWDSHGHVVDREVVVDSPFFIDATEVTFEQWDACARDGACPHVRVGGESGQPVRWITLASARAYCRWAGGDLPTDEQWILAAAGNNARRYAWGDTGVVCGRSDWGKAYGPCKESSTASPEWSGLMASDRTPEGVIGLSGGVSEWVLSNELGVIRGGSYKSKAATQLRTWWSELRDPDVAYDDVGLRCAYRETSVR